MYTYLCIFVEGDPTVDCMDDRVRLTFNTERPFKGRIFVKGMIENEKCVNNYVANNKQSVDFQLINGECNMRRARKVCVCFRRGLKKWV